MKRFESFEKQFLKLVLQKVSHRCLPLEPIRLLMRVHTARTGRAGLNLPLVRVSPDVLERLVVPKERRLVRLHADGVEEDSLTGTQGLEALKRIV